MKQIKIIRGDITRAEVDAVVNAANPGLLGGGGVDGAIHNASGPELPAACRRIKAVNGVRCPTGEARITPGFNLKAGWVIHTVGPRYGYDKNPELLLASAYESSLRTALANQCGSIAFPAISCGVYGYPAHEAASVALNVCCDKQWRELIIYFYLFREQMVEIWQDILKKTA